MRFSCRNTLWAEECITPGHEAHSWEVSVWGGNNAFFMVALSIQKNKIIFWFNDMEDNLWSLRLKTIYIKKRLAWFQFLLAIQYLCLWCEFFWWWIWGLRLTQFRRRGHVVDLPRKRPPFLIRLYVKSCSKVSKQQGWNWIHIQRI